MIKNKKALISFAILALTLTLGLTGCMRTINEPVAPEATVNPVPTMAAVPTESPMPTNAAVPTATPNMDLPGTANPPANNAVQETVDWKVRAAMVEKRIDMFSEIAESRVVVFDQTALVGIKFANQYKGEMTQRIRDMIAGEIMAVDTGIQVVAVTAETADVNTIYNLSDKFRTGVDEAALKDDIEKIVRNSTTLR